MKWRDAGQMRSDVQQTDCTVSWLRVRLRINDWSFLTTDLDAGP